jgi:hypothetical protein
MMKSTAATIIVGVVCLIGGYFAGREHVKYEIRSSILEAGKVFSEGLQGSLGDRSDTDESTTKNPTTDHNVTAQIESQIAEFVEYGEPFAAPEFEISITDARIDRPQVKDLFGDVGRGNSPVLILVFRVKNTHDRKILRYREENMFLAGHFQMRDDVDNIIRGVSYGAGSKPVGALTGGEDILSGKEVTHLEVFSVPPPKTRYLILTMDLGAFGGEGETRFKIPVENIKNFPPVGE